MEKTLKYIEGLLSTLKEGQKLVIIKKDEKFEFTIEEDFI